MNAPAFQFYAGDFIAGTITLSHAERGLYILALCLQWDQGGVSPDDLSNLAGDVPVGKVVKKFDLGEDGLLRNKRLEFERQKQADYRKAQSDKGKASAKARFNRGSTVVQPEKDSVEVRFQPKPNSPSPSPSSGEYIKGATTIPTVDDVIAQGFIIGIAEEDCRSWHADRQAEGWADKNGADIGNWKVWLTRHRDYLRSPRNGTLPHRKREAKIQF